MQLGDHIWGHASPAAPLLMVLTTLRNSSTESGSALSCWVTLARFLTLRPSTHLFTGGEGTSNNRNELPRFWSQSQVQVSVGPSGHSRFLQLLVAASDPWGFLGFFAGSSQMVCTGCRAHQTLVASRARRLPRHQILILFSAFSRSPLSSPLSGHSCSHLMCPC